MRDMCHNLLLTSLTDFYNQNPEYKKILSDIISGKHKLSLRLIDWLVTHYSKSRNIFYWIQKNDKNISEIFPTGFNSEQYKRFNLYLDYRAQLKSYAKVNFDSFRRHERITFYLDDNFQENIETTIGQLNFFRWVFNSNIIQYALNNYDEIYQNMIDNNSYNKTNKPAKQIVLPSQDITQSYCTLRFD
jgi:hypothetical protein